MRADALDRRVADLHVDRGGCLAVHSHRRNRVVARVGRHCPAADLARLRVEQQSGRQLGRHRPRVDGSRHSLRRVQLHGDASVAHDQRVGDEGRTTTTHLGDGRVEVHFVDARLLRRQLHRQVGLLLELSVLDHEDVTTLRELDGCTARVTLLAVVQVHQRHVHVVNVQEAAAVRVHGESVGGGDDDVDKAVEEREVIMLEAVVQTGHWVDVLLVGVHIVQLRLVLAHDRGMIVEKLHGRQIAVGVVQPMARREATLHHVTAVLDDQTNDSRDTTDAVRSSNRVLRSAGGCVREETRNGTRRGIQMHSTRELGSGVEVGQFGVGMRQQRLHREAGIHHHVVEPVAQSGGLSDHSQREERHMVLRANGIHRSLMRMHGSTRNLIVPFRNRVYDEACNKTRGKWRIDVRDSRNVQPALHRFNRLIDITGKTRAITRPGLSVRLHINRK